MMDIEELNKVTEKIIGCTIEVHRTNNRKRMIIWTLFGAKNNDFYRKHGGIQKENKEIEIGTVKYSGIGFSFNLQPIGNVGGVENDN